MPQATAYKRTMGGSIGAGIGSVFSGSGKTYFILEHKTNSKYYRAGETQEIIVDQVELGRDPKCQVRFDDSFPTVSRRHAAIARDGSRWKLIQLSSTNSTLLNGQKISNESYLQNGDEIQLSSTGPRINFIVPAGNKSTVGSIGLTRRLNLFGQQALRPYKRAISALSVLLVLVIAGGIYWGVKQAETLVEAQNRILAQSEQLKDTEQKLEESLKLYEDNPEKLAAIAAELDITKRKLAENQSALGELRRKAATAGNGEKATPTPSGDSPTSPGRTEAAKAPGDISACNPHVFAVFLDRISYETSDGRKEEFSAQEELIGSGFMLGDGRFVTARHVLETWYYYQQLNDQTAANFYKLMNYAAFNGGKISARFTIISPTNKRYSFTNEQIICDRSNDKAIREGAELYTVAVLGRNDWAYFQTNASSGLAFDNELSRSLPQRTQLDVLGFPSGMGTEDIYNLQPIYSNCITARAGLNSDGLIVTSNNNTTGGNSGGPVLAYKDGKYVVVGLVSGGIYEKDLVVPISEVKR
jgi:nitrogen fixation-related uncharacterized protein